MRKKGQQRDGMLVESKMAMAAVGMLSAVVMAVHERHESRVHLHAARAFLWPPAERHEASLDMRSYRHAGVGHQIETALRPSEHWQVGVEKWWLSLLDFR